MYSVYMYMHTVYMHTHTHTQMDTGCFHILAIVKTLLWECRYLSNYCFSFPWINTQKWIPESYGSSVCNFLRNLHTAFRRGCTTWLAYTCTRVLFSLCSHQRSFAVFLITAVPAGVRCCLTVVWICVSLMTSNGEHAFMCLLVTSVSLGKCPFRLSSHF